MRSLLIAALEDYKNSNHVMHDEHEVIVRFIDFINGNENCFERGNHGHVTGSAWIINHTQSHALLTHHKKFNAWLQLGGHADGDPDIKNVSLREAQEESGIVDFQFITPVIFDVSIYSIQGQCGYHYDVRYLLQAPENAVCVVSEESIDLAWISFDELTHYTQEREVLRMNEKFLKFFKN
ncbi:MAG: NUDIX hydrolase [Candidatus Dependentiae bacterium]